MHFSHHPTGVLLGISMEFSACWLNRIAVYIIVPKNNRDSLGAAYRVRHVLVVFHEKAEQSVVQPLH